MIKFSVDAFPKFTRNRILTVILLVGISLTAGGIALAVSSVPNPGHNISGLGGYSATGDLIYGTDGVNGGMSSLPDIATGNVLISGGVGAAPSWGKVGLTTHVTGTLPTANLGSGTANSTTFLRGDQTWATPAAGGVAWGAITGTLSSQTDLNTALGLDEKTANKNASGGYAGLSGVNLQIYNTGGTVLSNLITGATTPRTYTFPDVSGNVLTSGAAVTIAQGGTGSAPGATDQVLIADSASAATWRTLPDCSGNGKALRFTAATNTFDCNTLQFYTQSVTTPAAVFATDTYLTGSGIAIPTAGMQAGTRYHVIFSGTKTAAGTVAPTINIRFGTGNAVGDASRCLMTLGAGTAAADTAIFEVWATFRTVGTGTTAIIQCVVKVDHALAVTGFTTTGAAGTGIIQTTGGGFDSTVGSSFISTSVNGGTSSVWSVALVQAELTNLN